MNLERILKIAVLAALLSAAPAGPHGDVRAVLGDAPRAYQLADMKMFNWVILNIKDNYIDQKRIGPREMLSAALNHVERLVPEVIVTEAENRRSITVQTGERRQEFAVTDINTIWEMAWKIKDIFTFMQANLTASTDVREIEYAAVNGMLSTLDPHSFFLKPDSYKEIKTSTKGKFGGLGIQIQARDGYITIVAPLKDTPAWRAGLKKLDKIVRIDDESTANMNIDEAVNRLRGTPGTKVTIWIMREGLAEPRKYTLTREEIKIVTIESKLLPDGVGWIRLLQFSEESAGDLTAHFNRLKDENKGHLRGLVLDMRDNPGGLLESSIKISNFFLKSGIIVSTVAQEGRKVEERKADDSGFRIDVPVAVLINGGSASASEIVAGALKDNDRALIIGQKSFGKGSVQVLYEKSVPPDDLSRERRDAGLKLTVAQYLTPADVSIQSVGISPDIFLQPMRVDKRGTKLFYRERPHKEKDLAKHLDDTKAREEKPALTLKFLTDEKDPGADEDDADDIKEKDEKKKEKEAKEDDEGLSEDFPVRYARLVIGRTQSPTRSAMIAAAKEIQEKTAALEEERLAAALGGAGIEWSPGPSAAAPQVKARLSIERKDGKAAAAPVLNAGEEAFLVLTAKNAGPADVHRLSAVVESKDNLLDGREFLFGRVPAGGEKARKVKVKVPRDYLSGVSEYHVKLHAGDAPLSEPLKGRVIVSELPRPRFSTTYRIADPSPGGNGNGDVEPGETVSIAATVKNLGAGAAAKPKVSVRNLGGKEIFIKNGRCELDPMPQGKSAACALTIEVKKEMHEDRFAVMLSTFDSELGESASEKLVIGVSGAGLVPPRSLQQAALSPRNGTLSPPEIKIGPVPNNIIVESSSVTLEGVAVDAGGIKDVYVKVNDKKVFYKAADGKTKTVPFKVSLQLKDGMNSVYVVARKTDDLMSVDKYIITRPTAAEPGDKPTARKQ
ncbi:MAG: PDZ domain-containing protein [Deltaproteobacteria bacterium]|nr:PDZ domain-containing protein [Deltaproteobacteria bacterium]